MEVSISNLLDRIQHNAVVVPSFQREYEWNEDQAKKLMSSLFNAYPTGSLLFWETASPPELKNIDFKPQPGVLVQVILDGQQRLTTLFMLITGKIPPYYRTDEITHDPRALHFNAETTEFKYVGEHERESNPLWVRITDAVNGRCDPYELAEARLGKGDELVVLARKINPHLNTLRKILDQTYPIQTIPNSANIVDAIRVFDLVNRQGTKLSEADLAMAQISGKWPQARDIIKLKLAALKKKRFDLDLTFIARCMTAVVTGRAEYELIHDRSKEELISGWNKLSNVLDYLISILQEHAFIHSTADLSTTSVLVPIVAFLANNRGMFANAQEQNRFLHWMYAALLWGRYSGQTDQRLDKDIGIVLKSATPTTDLEKEILDQRGRIAVLPGDIDGRDIRNAIYRMAFIVAKSRKAVDWFNGKPLSTIDIYTGVNAYIFPQELLYKQYDAANYSHRLLVNEIANRVVLATWPSIASGADDPLAFLEKVEQKYPGTLKAQCIPSDRSLWQVDKYLAFAAARRNLLADSINVFMDGLLKGTAPEKEDLAAIIAVGETNEVEFKQSVRLDLHTKQIDPRLFEKVAREVAAFMNAQGGKLIVGATDAGIVVGIEEDVASFDQPNKPGTEDHLRLALMQSIQARISLPNMGYAHMRFETVHDKRICVIDIDAAPNPVFISAGQSPAEFYVRLDTSAQKFDVRQANEYIDSHWQNAG